MGEWRDVRMDGYGNEGREVGWQTCAWVEG